MNSGLKTGEAEHDSSVAAVWDSNTKWNSEKRTEGYMGTLLLTYYFCFVCFK